MNMKEKRKYSDRAEYMIKAVTKRRKKLKEMAIEYKGGKCILCGYDKCIRSLNMHHKDPSQRHPLVADSSFRSGEFKKAV